MAALFNFWRSAGTHIVTDTLPPRTGGARAADHAYQAMITPLAELIKRLGWGVIIVLLLILSYRITDSVWGSFANPFYLKELQYSGDEVAFASKIFGVLMTMAGIALGALLFVLIGRMPTLLLGAITAAVTNLLYADLAVGGPGIDAFSTSFLRMLRMAVAPLSALERSTKMVHARCAATPRTGQPARSARLSAWPPNSESRMPMSNGER